MCKSGRNEGPQDDVPAQQLLHYTQMTVVIMTACNTNKFFFLLNVF